MNSGSGHEFEDFDDDGSLEDGSANTDFDVESLTPNIMEHRQRAICCGLDKQRLIIVSILVVALVLFVFSAGMVLSATPSCPIKKICQTEGCVLTAASLVKNMNQSADPCVDFYEYACGGWANSHPIPEDKNSFGTFTLLRDSNQEILRSLLERGSSLGPPSSAASKTRALYQQCMDVDAIEAADPLPSSLPFLPVNIVDDHASVVAAITSLHEIGVGALIYMVVGADDHSSSSNALFVGQTGLTLRSRDYYVGKDPATDKTLAALGREIEAMFALSTFPPVDAAAATAIVAFEKSLAEIFVPDSELRDPKAAYNEVLVADSSWKSLFTRVSPGVQRVVASSVPYLSRLETLLATTPNKALSDYFNWQVLLHLAPHLSQKFVDARFKFIKEVFGVAQEPPRWTHCVSFVDGALGFSLGAMFIETHFAQKSQDVAKHMIRAILDAFESRLGSLPWLDEATRALAKGKAEAVLQKIGFPSNLHTPAQLNAYYSGLTFGQDYFSSAITALRWQVSDNLGKLGVPVDTTEWDMTPPTVNAYYNPTTNEIVFPAGILQAPFFSGDALLATNFGAIGVVIGHELTHGFDDQGSQYDKDGNLLPWWPSAVRQTFQQLTRCVAEQYSRYTTPAGEHLNGNLTLGENIADNGGLAQAFRAYRAAIGEAGDEEEPRLPALPHLSGNQLFFLSFASVWCENERPASLHRSLLTDPHSPGAFRVIGALSNSQDFAREFACPVGSPMNPEKKCNLW